jgi:NADH-quinone oxidoreductase subunit C
MSEFLNKVEEKLNEKFPGELVKAELLYDFPVITIKSHSSHDILKFLKEDSEFNFHFLTDLTGMQTEDEKELGVIYHLHNMPKNIRLRVKTFIPMSSPDIKSVTDIWAGANWMERETYDFFGVKFAGHPNLVRILNVDEMDIFPLRKEYPLEDQTRDDKSDKMFGR